MYQIDFHKPCHIHFIGIGGISMSGLAEILLSEGFTVSGSDMKASALTEHLQKLGAKIAIGQRAENIEAPDVVVYTAAIHPDNPELSCAREKHIPLLTRAELLGELMRNYRQAINIAGTHGKTTTTSMITEILLSAKLNPTVTVGGILDSIGGNIRVGGSDYFVAEACEYTNSFLSFYPTISVILNVEADHLDFFKDLDDIRKSFREFALRLPQNETGFLVLNGDIRDKEYFLDGLSCKVATFGHAFDNDYAAKDIVYDEKACPSYTLLVHGKEAGRVSLGVTGEHNVYNSLAAIAVADRLSVPREKTFAALSRFHGTERRFEYKGEVNGFTIIDDYAHHPQEIAATLAAAKRYPHKRLYVAFQPHTYSRTKALMDSFAEALAAADEVIITDIYAAREKNTVGVKVTDLVDKINACGGHAVYKPDFPSIEKFILKKLKTGDLLITMGAGNIVEVGNQLLSM